MEHTVMPGRPAPTHDLIRLREPIALSVGRAGASVGRAGARTDPWVVVRRGYVRDGMMPVGVRGLTRKSGLPPFWRSPRLADRLSPEELTDSRHVIERSRKDAVPALAALARVAPILASRGHRWGPGGSVGFEIATRRCDGDIFKRS